MELQSRLQQKGKERFDYDNRPQVNYIHNGSQRIETSRGCPHLCPFCYEPNKLKVFPLPATTKDFVQILDMNFLWQPDVVDRIKQLKNRGTKYEAVCGFDFRYMTQEIANALKEARFVKVRIAWDWYMRDQYKINDALQMLMRAGYKAKELSCFVVTNWKIPVLECERKLDLLKVWNVKVCDCCFDGGYKQAIPEHWTQEEIKEFRAKCRKHNQLVNFRIDPECEG